VLAKKERPRIKNAFLFVGILGAACIIVFFSSTAIVGALGQSLKKTAHLPDGYTALKLCDFNRGHRPVHYNFYRSFSFIVPVNYTYHEVERGFFVDTNVIRAVNPVVAKMIYYGMLKSESLKSSIKVTAAPAQKWKADRVCYLYKDQSEVLLLKGNLILCLQCNKSLSDAKMRKICLSKFHSELQG
jgi:hypothetical protein